MQIESSTQDGCSCPSGSVAVDRSPKPDALTGGVRLHISEMDCPTEERMIRAKLEPMHQVEAMGFNLLERILIVRSTEGGLPAIIQALKEIGFSAEIVNGNQPRASDKQAHKYKTYLSLAFAALCAGGAEVLHAIEFEPEWLVLALSTLALALSGLTTYKKGWIAVRHLDFNINALMSIAVTGAMLIGEWPEAAMVMVLFTLAEVIESKSLEHARNAIRELMALAPDTATVKDADNQWRTGPVEEVVIGQIVRVRPGEKIPLDGEIISGSAAINQAPVTGESLPIEKTVGDAVFAGTLNQTGLLELRVVASAENSTIARIIHAVEAAQNERAPAQHFIDRFARIYTPAVLGLAVVAAVLMPFVWGLSWFDAVYRALVLLVIACPCALVISTPVTVVCGLATAARHGVLVKGGLYLELGRKLDMLAFDKTGTLTEGKVSVTDLQLFGEARRFDALLFAASLARHSDHPVSQAVVRYAREQEPLHPYLPVEDFHSSTGRGVQGQIDGLDSVLGNHRLIHELGHCTSALESALEAVEKQGKTAVVLLRDNRPWALFTIADQVKTHSRKALELLKELGVHTLVLSGDNPYAVASIAAQLGIEDARGDLLPEQKLEVLRELKTQYATVGMVGDGINDAPAMAGAQISFAMGAAGTDTALETADVALMDDNLEKLPWFIQLSRTTGRRLTQNICLALGIKVLFMVLALTGEATLWMAVFADMGASLLVVFNGLRLLNFK